MAAPKKHETPIVSSFSTDRKLLNAVKVRALKESERLNKHVSTSAIINEALKLYLRGKK